MFYNKNGIIVDETRYYVRGETFPINAIASVGAVKVYGPLKEPLVTLGMIGSFLGLAAIFNGYGVLGLMLLVVGAPLLYFAFQYKFAVRITNAAGDADSFKSKDREEVFEIVDAINKSIINRG